MTVPLENLYRPHAAALQIPKKAYDIQMITQRFIAAAHRQNLRVYMWTINDPKETQAFFSMGVDGIITDYPQILAK